MGKANESQVKKVAEAIKGAKKPVILAGGGVVISDATNEFRKFVKETDIPVVSTMMGIGILPSDNPRYYGMIGSHGVKRANLLFNRADLVIVMGSRLGDRTVANVKGLEEGNKLIHIDLDPAEIGKTLSLIFLLSVILKMFLNSLHRKFQVTRQAKSGLTKLTNYVKDLHINRYVRITDL